MKAYLLKMRLKGIKNIDKEIQLDFYNKKLKDAFDLSSNIKAIYGANGVGKSGIINAVEIYQQLILTDNYLSDNINLKFLSDIINKKTNALEIEMTYIWYDVNNYKIKNNFTHFIKIKMDDKENYVISKEKIIDNFKKKDKMIVEITDGKIDLIRMENKNEIIRMSMNLLNKKSISTIIADDMLTNGNQMVLPLLTPWLFAYYLNVVLPKEDIHKDFYYRKNKIDYYNELLIDNEQLINITSDNDVILIDFKKEYIKIINQLTEFLKLFKSELKSIEIQFKENNDLLICEKLFCYEGYKIHSEFESTGIKKLIRLFTAFKKMNNGEIVFIDELDANLHDVYLCKLLEYFDIYGKGQLCFTTHNLATMDILNKSRNRKHAVDFLTGNSVITSWVKNGNASASKMYRGGMVENSPFNIEPFDFLGLFEEGE